MTYRAYMWGMRFLVLISAVLFFLVISRFDPGTGNVEALVLFYLTLILFLSGLLTMILLFFRRKVTGLNAAQGATGLSFRQGILMSLALTSILMLRGFGMLVWWDALIVIAAICLIELYFLSRA